MARAKRGKAANVFDEHRKGGKAGSEEGQQVIKRGPQGRSPVSTNPMPKVL